MSIGPIKDQQKCGAGWCGRYERCPWQVPIIIGEAGIDMYVKDPNVDPGKRGWQGVKDKAAYFTEIKEYHNRLMGDPRIHSIQWYTLDYGHPWASFDLEPLRSAIAVWAATVTAPDTKFGYVTAPAGLNMRAEPSQAGRVITTFPLWRPRSRSAAKLVNGYQTVHLGQPGYVFASYISDAPAQTTE
jgi:hypothetical protein